MGFIYQILNTKTNKSYIGQSRQKNKTARWCQHKHAAMVKKSNTSALYCAMRSHGIEVFTYTILLDEVGDDDLNKKEIEFIQFFNSIVPNGYNIKEGGNHIPHTEETKRKIGEKSKGRKTNNGRVFSDEWRKNIGKASKGRTFTDETNARRRESINVWHKNNPIAHKNCKYTEDDIRYMRKNPDNLTLKDIAIKFNVKPYRIQRIIDKTMYKHVADD